MTPVPLELSLLSTYARYIFCNTISLVSTLSKLTTPYHHKPQGKESRQSSHHSPPLRHTTHHTYPYPFYTSSHIPLLPVIPVINSFPRHTSRSSPFASSSHQSPHALSISPSTFPSSPLRNTSHDTPLPPVTPAPPPITPAPPPVTPAPPPSLHQHQTPLRPSS